MSIKISLIIGLLFILSCNKKNEPTCVLLHETRSKTENLSDKLALCTKEVSELEKYKKEFLRHKEYQLQLEQHYQKLARQKVSLQTQKQRDCFDELFKKLNSYEPDAVEAWRRMNNILFRFTHSPTLWEQNFGGRILDKRGTVINPSQFIYKTITAERKFAKDSTSIARELQDLFGEDEGDLIFMMSPDDFKQCH